MTHPTRSDLPLDFRSAEVSRILRYVVAGDSCSIVGIGSVGKTNLLRFLTRRDVLEKYLPAEAGRMQAVFIDANKLVRPTRWGLYELMLFQLAAALRQHPAGPETAGVDDCYESLVASPDRALAIRWLDRALQQVITGLGFEVIFLLDEFDDLYRRLPGRALAGLRALRDDFKYRLSYVVSTRLELSRLRAEDAAVESFSELLRPRQVWLSTYNAADSAFMLKRLQGRYQAAAGPEQVSALFELCGGHPGLISAAFQAWAAGVPLASGPLSDHPAVSDECARIWSCLLPDEQNTLFNLAGSPGSLLETGRLAEKGLVVTGRDGKTRLFSALLVDYLLRTRPPLGARLYVDASRRAVFLDQQRVADVNGRELSLLQMLDARRGEVVTYDEIIRNLYPEYKDYSGRLENTDELAGVIKRLRGALRTADPGCELIVTVRGEGLRLDDGLPNPWKAGV